jgi:hypothetical protein
VIGATVEVTDNSGLIVDSVKTDSSGLFIFVGGVLGSSNTFRARFAGTSALASSESRNFTQTEFCGTFPRVIGGVAFAFQRNPEVRESWKPVSDLLLRQSGVRTVFLTGEFLIDAPLSLNRTYIGGSGLSGPATMAMCLVISGTDPEPDELCTFDRITFDSQGVGGVVSLFDRNSFPSTTPPTMPFKTAFNNCTFKGKSGHLFRFRGGGLFDYVSIVGSRFQRKAELTNIDARLESCDIGDLDIFGANGFVLASGGQFTGTWNIGTDGSAAKVAAVGCLGRPGSIVNVDPAATYARDPSSEAQTQNGVNSVAGGGSV